MECVYRTLIWPFAYVMITNFPITSAFVVAASV